LEFQNRNKIAEHHQATMTGSSAMSNIRSPLRMNFAGEVVKDEAIETKDQKAKVKKLLSQKENKSTKEKWFRVVRQTKKKDEQNSNQNHGPLDGFFATIEMFVCGPGATDIENQKKPKKGRLSTLTIPVKTEKKKNDPKVVRSAIFQMDSLLWPTAYIHCFASARLSRPKKGEAQINPHQKETKYLGFEDPERQRKKQQIIHQVCRKLSHRSSRTRSPQRNRNQRGCPT
jgi:hypothetical protein